jgi:hypothetical protein
MNHKISRNDACSCGSGEKYKKCCMEAKMPPASNVLYVDFKWRQLCQLEGMVAGNHLIPYATQELPDDVVNQALADFLPEDLPEGMDMDIMINNFFPPWFLFNWIPLEDFGLKKFDSEKTIADNYLKTHRARLSSQERLFIEAIGRSYYSFYSVLQVEAEKSLTVKDILLGTTHTLKERQGTYQLKRGDIIFTRILTLDGQSISIGMAPFIVPAYYQAAFLDLRKWLVSENNDTALTREELRDKFDRVILDHFFEIIKILFNRPLPMLMNTDDELLLFSKSYFKLTLEPEKALNYLLPLTLEGKPDKFLQGAKKDKSGKIKQIKFSWLKKGNKKNNYWDKTVLGQVTLEPGRLILETNSQERSQRGAGLLGKFLGDAISFQTTLIETPEQKMKSLSAASSGRDEESQRLLASPEVQESIKVMTKKYWDDWFDKSIPMLEDKTPREAAKTKDGKERLEALLLHYERCDLEKKDNVFKADIDYLRKELDLEP